MRYQQKIIMHLKVTQAVSLAQ